MHQVEILIYDGFDELDAIAPFEILAAAGFEVSLVSLRRSTMIRTAHGALLRPHGVLADPELLVVPGGGWASRAPQGAWAEVRDGASPVAIAERHHSGSTIAGVCTGVMLLAASGLLSGRPAVTHRVALDDLRDCGAEVIPGARVVDDGDVLTAGGVTSAIDLALHIVGREKGYDAAAASANRIEHERRGQVVETARSRSGRHTANVLVPPEG